MKEGLIAQLKTQQMFFLNTVICLTEDDSSFKPKDEMFTVAQHIGHAAETYTWFMDGAFGNGFDMNFDNINERLKSYTSFDICIQFFVDEVEKAVKTIENVDENEFLQPLPGEIMPGAPKMAVISGLNDHTAHHRGALSVYARLLGKTPKMPYMG